MSLPFYECPYCRARIPDCRCKGPELCSAHGKLNDPNCEICRMVKDECLSDSAVERLVSLDRIIAEAVVLAGGEHQCAALGHRWKSIGGRACPFHEEGCGNASQGVFECESCGEVDYGDKPGYPGYDWCAGTHFNCGLRAL